VVKKKPLSCWSCHYVGSEPRLNMMMMVCRYGDPPTPLGGAAELLPVPETCPKKGEKK
jgi:hypothetical protein